jgi:predicted metal-dependent phosphotriesterase family hydrolase
VDEEFDYGLDPGETFAPTVHEDEEFDLNQPHVMTVLGAVDPAALGFTLHHEHLFNHVNPLAVTDPDLVIDDLASSAADLELYSAAGGRAIVDMGPADYGRSIADLLWLAQRFPVHLICTTGHHKDLIAAPWVGTDGAEVIAGRNISEILEGIDGTGVRAGVVKAGTSLNEITEVERRVLAAAARTQLATGVPISTHTELGTMALEQIDILTAAGADPAHIIIGHMDARLEDQEYLRQVLDQGVFLSFDRWTRHSMAPDQQRASALADLAAAGYLDQLLVSGDLARKSNHLGYGGQFGFDYMVDHVPLMLMEAGFTALQVRRVFVDNPARALTIHRPL